MPLDVPTMTPATALSFEGEYTGLVPEGMERGQVFNFEVEVEGVQTMDDDEGPHVVPAPAEESPEESAPFVERELLSQKEHRERRTEEQSRHLEPNKGSDVKIEKYAFGMEFELVLGRPCRLSGVASPDTDFRISGVECNVPCPSFARAAHINVANVTGVGVGGPVGTHTISLRELPGKEERIKIADVGGGDALPVVHAKSGAIDLWNLRGKGIVDLPTLTPANSVRLVGFYDGKVPAGYEEGEVFRLSVAFFGYASIVA